MRVDRRASSILVPAEPNAALKRLDVRLGEFILHVNFISGKLVLSRANRPDLAHLTFDWMTASGVLDIHLTYGHEARTIDPTAELYVPVAKIPLDRMARFGESVAAGLEGVALRWMRNFRKYRPGWLARNGYVVMLLDEPFVTDWFRRAVPKRRGKYRVDPQMIFNENEVDPALVQAMVDGLEEPNVLHSLKGVPMRTPVSAIRLGRRGSDPRDNIPINWQLGPDGTVGWWGMTNAASRAMGVEMSSHFLAPVLPLIQDHHAVGFEKIVAGLGLADFEPTRQLSEGILRFLREPTTRLRLPNGRAVPRIPVKSPPLVSSTAAAGT